MVRVQHQGTTLRLFESKNEAKNTANLFPDERWEPRLVQNWYILESKDTGRYMDSDGILSADFTL